MDNVVELKRINEELARKFVEIERNLIQAADPVALFEAWMKGMVGAFQIPFLWISLVDIPENERLAKTLRTSSLLKDRLSVVDEATFVALTPNGFQPVLVNEALRPYFRLLPKEKYFVRSMAVAPLSVQERRIGSLNHGDPSPSRYDPRMDTRLLQSLADRVSSRLASMAVWPEPPPVDP